VAAKVWTVGEAMDWTVEYFDENDVSEPRRSAEWLLSAATGLTRIELYAFRGRPLSAEERVAFKDGIKRRAQGMPLQYVTGEVPFRHIVLKVESGVFIPRPETELLVEEGLKGVDVAGPVVVAIDLCTGSGAVAISLAEERKGVTVYATDVSEDAVRIARENVSRTGVEDRVRILHGDLFEPLPDDIRGNAAVVLANPPYIPSSRVSTLPAEVADHEPHRALDGGQDGLEVVERIALQAGEWLVPGGMLAIEIDETHADQAQGLVAASLGIATVLKDLAGRDRIVVGNKEA